MKKQLNIFVFLVFSLLILACKNSAGSNFESGPTSVEMAVESDVAASKSESPSSGLAVSKPRLEQGESAATLPQANEKINKIIKDGNITIEVNKIDEAKLTVDKIVKQYDGYYEIDAFNATQYQSKYDIKIRVKNDKFDQLTNQLLNIEGDVKHKDINARDVTEEFLDTESRLTSSKVYLKRYQELLSRANTIKDIIEIENKIQEIQINIDAYMGKLKYLNDRVDYSTLSLEIIQNHEHFEANNNDNFWIKMVNAFKSGIDIILGLFLFLIRIWPLIILGGLILFFRERLFAKLKFGSGKK